MYYPVYAKAVQPSRTSFCLFGIPRRSTRNVKPSVIRARPLSWDIPKLIFERPERLFPRPERLLGGNTFKEFILTQGEAVKDFPWDYVIFLCIAIFVILEFILRPFDEEIDEAEADKDDRQISTTDREQTTMSKKKEMTKEQEAIYAMQKMAFQEDQNRNLLLLGSFTALALWLAGFLNTRHPFEP